MKLNLAILPGDGIGPEIIEQAMKTVKAVTKKFNHELTYEYGITGACAIDKGERQLGIVILCGVATKIARQLKVDYAGVYRRADGGDCNHLGRP